MIDLFVNGKLLKSINSAPITLIAKMDKPSSVEDFRPIACCTIMYKIVVKIMVSRLQQVLPLLVGCGQSAFVKGRDVHDNILLTHELVNNYQRKQISPRVVIKVDIRKAYDIVEWDIF